MACPFGSGYRAVSFWARGGAVFQYNRNSAPPERILAHIPHALRLVASVRDPAIAVSQLVRTARAPENAPRHRPDVAVQGLYMGIHELVFGAVSFRFVVYSSTIKRPEV